MAMTPKQIIAVVQHFEAGGEVQYKARDNSKWITADSPAWNFAAYDYRHKPKPLELWVNVPSNGGGIGTAFHNQATAEFCRTSKERTVHMREVVDE